MNIAKKFVNALKGKTKPSGYDATATVVRVEGSTAWVAIDGGIDETPVRMSINVKKGDTVNVRVSGGRAWITGNDSAPPTDDKKADAVASNLKTEVGRINKANEIIQAGLIEITGDVSEAEKKATSFIGTVPGYQGICVFNETSGTPETFINLDPSVGDPAMNIIVGGKKKASYGDDVTFYGVNGNTLYQALSIEPLFSSTPDGGTYSGGTIQFSAYDTSRSGPRIEGARYLSGSIYKTGIAAYSDTFTIYGTVEASGFKGLPLRGGTLSPDNEVTVQNQTWKNCGHFTVPAGTWTITVLLRFAENATGRRALMLAESASDAASGSSLNLSAIAVDNAVSGTRTYLRLTYVTQLDEPFTYYIGAWQNSGASLATAVRVRWAGIEEL